MSVAVRPVNAPLLNYTPKSELTLSAVGDLDLEPAGSPAPPAEATVRDERDPYIETETELRYAWGDR